VDYGQLWDPIKVAPGETLLVRFGPLDFWIHRGDREWHMAHAHVPDGPERLGLERLPEMPGLDWTRWVINEQVDEVLLQPRMPDRPLIVRPEMPVCLLPNQSVRFYIGVSSWVSVSLGQRFRDILEIPTARLSNSWFGPATEGELCYAMRTTAKLREEDLQGHPHRAVVPLEVRNLSDEKLDFERLCLHTDNLRIYQGDGRMWSNQGRVSYRGADKWSRVAYARGAPPYDRAERLVGAARRPAERGALLRTFGDWKNLIDL